MDRTLPTSHDASRTAPHRASISSGPRRVVRRWFSGGVAAVLLALLTTTPAAAIEGWLTDLDEARAQAAKGDRYILVDLYAEWCGWCKELENKVFTTDEFRARTKDFVLLQVDTEDQSTGTALHVRYRVRSLPTTLILDADMAQVGQVRGFHPTGPFLSQIEALVDKHEQLVAQFEKQRVSDEPQILEVLAKELHQRFDGKRSATLYERLLEIYQPTEARHRQVLYKLTDAYRIAERFTEADQALGRAQKAATSSQDTRLVEALDLLRIQIAQDQGSCAKTRGALEDFLAAHPASDFHRQASRSLKALPACG